LDIPRIFNITESAHRIMTVHTREARHSRARCVWNRYPSARPRQRFGGDAVHLARDHGVIGTGIDMSQLFTSRRDSALKSSAWPIKSASSMVMLPASSLTRRSMWQPVSVPRGSAGESTHNRVADAELRPGGIILIGEPYCGSYRRRKMSPRVSCRLDHRLSPASELIASFGHLGYDVVEMVLANQDSWDRYEAAKWLTMRRWLEANPDDEFAKRCEPTDLGTERHAACTREYLGWACSR